MLDGDGSRRVLCPGNRDEERDYAEGTFLVEQQAYFGVERDRIDWLRIMCSGYRRVEPNLA